MKNLALVVAIAFTIILQTTSFKKDKNDPPTIPQYIYQSSLTNPSLEELQAFYDARYDTNNGNVELTGIVGLLNMQLLSILYANELAKNRLLGDAPIYKDYKLCDQSAPDQIMARFMAIRTSGSAYLF